MTWVIEFFTKPNRSIKEDPSWSPSIDKIVIIKPDITWTIEIL